MAKPPTEPLPPRNPVRYWRQESPGGLQNFGDYLTELFLAEMLALPRCPADAFHLIGSVIHEPKLYRTLDEVGADPATAKVAFWGCGLRSETPMSKAARERSAFFGVRGPLTRSILGLPADTVLGDPGLLLPLLQPTPLQRHGRTVCITHFNEKRPPSELRAETSADEVVTAAIAPRMDAIRSMIDQIAGPGFILSGSLHGAIAACAFGVPFAFYDSGYIDVPFKWRDFAASVGVPCAFASSVQEGQALYRDKIAPALRVPPLLPILMQSPFSVVPEVLIKALRTDGRRLGSDRGEANHDLIEPSGFRAMRMAAQSRWSDACHVQHHTGSGTD